MLDLLIYLALLWDTKKPTDVEDDFLVEEINKFLELLVR